MTVKDLIQRLKKWDPNAEVRIGRYCGNVDWSIKGIAAYIPSPLDDEYYVYLSCEDSNHKADNIPQISSWMEKTNLPI